MITKVSDNIISPLGMTTEENYRNVRDGRTELRCYNGLFGLPEQCCVSIIDRDKIREVFETECGDTTQYTYYEQLAILSAKNAIDRGAVNAADRDVVFVISTTKGNVDRLEDDLLDERAYIGATAEKIARFFGNDNTPIVASNACISGVCAQIAAIRSLKGGEYKTAVVIGCDVLSRFIISGFQSFKALSQENCRPYDINRVGLNLGEAAGTIILRKTNDPQGDSWCYVSSSIHNDANHISGPSRTGEGSYRVLRDILEMVELDHLAFVNAHGTATAYNDEMESIAIHRAELDRIPVNGLKGYYGHTLGAAGVIETILSMAAVDDGAIIPTRGYGEVGTSYELNISNEARQTDKKTFIKILSGFGGSNAGIAYRKGGAE